MALWKVALELDYRLSFRRKVPHREEKRIVTSTVKSLDDDGGLLPIKNEEDQRYCPTLAEYLEIEDVHCVWL